MMRSFRHSSVAVVLAFLAACGGDDTSNPPAASGDASVDASPDRGTPPSDGAKEAKEDRAEPVEDAPVEGSANMDATDAPATADAADAPSRADASDGGPTTDTGTLDALDAGAKDSTSSDANDAASCVASLATNAAVSGDYYIRSNGSAVNGQNGTVVLDDATGTPLLGITQIVLERFGACALRGADGTV